MASIDRLPWVSLAACHLEIIVFNSMFIWQINYVCMYVDNFPNWEPKGVCLPILNQSPLISWFAANSHRLIWAKNTGILSKTAKFFRSPYSLDPRSRECIPTSPKNFYGGNLIFQPWAQMPPLSRTVLPIFPTRKSWICDWLFRTSFIKSGVESRFSVVCMIQRKFELIEDNKNTHSK